MLLTLFFLQRIFLSQCLINLDWVTLEREVTIRYFSPELYTPSQVSEISWGLDGPGRLCLQDVDDLWYGMGRNITCRVQVASDIFRYMSQILINSCQDKDHVSVTLPSEFVSNHPIKAFTHGFSSRVISDEKTLFVDGDNGLLTVYIIPKSWTYLDSLDEFIWQGCQRHSGGLARFGLLYRGNANISHITLFMFYWKSMMTGITTPMTTQLGTP